MYSDPNQKTLWQRRAEAAGFFVWNGRNVQEMMDKEIQHAFNDLLNITASIIFWRS